jgi:hypothetical protein
MMALTEYSHIVVSISISVSVSASYRREKPTMLVGCDISEPADAFSLVVP